MEATTYDMEEGPIVVDLTGISDEAEIYKPGEYELRLEWRGDLRSGESESKRGGTFKWYNFGVMVTPVNGKGLDPDAEEHEAFGETIWIPGAGDTPKRQRSFKRFVNAFAPQLDPYNKPVVIDDTFWEALDEAVAEGRTSWSQVGLGKDNRDGSPQNEVTRWGSAT